MDFGRLFRFALVGVASNVLGYAVYLLVTYWFLGPKLAMTILYAMGVIVGFVGNKKFTFRDQSGWWSTGLKYLIAHTLGYAVNFALLYVFVDQMRYPHQIVQAVAILVVAAYMFLALNVFVFKRSEMAV